MKKHFYSHIVEIESLVVELEQLNLSKEEKNHLLSLAQSSLHHAILDIILSELSEEDKKIFLNNLILNNHNNVWRHLNSKIKNIEEKIKETSKELIKDLHKDIKEVKKK